MILGIGIDIVEIARIAAAYEKFGDRLLNRLLRPSEAAYCRAQKSPAPALAARFAAKEAIAKALGTGIGAALAWHDMEVARRVTGEPYAILHGAGQACLRARGGRTVWLSLTHAQDYAAAVAVLEGDG